MSNSLYKEEIMEHWKHPQNWGILKNADFVVDKINPLCGDSIHLTGKINNDNISGIKFVSNGCVISKASASILTEYAKNKKFSDIQELDQHNFLNLIAIPLTATRKGCALLCYFALQKALKMLALRNVKKASNGYSNY